MLLVVASALAGCASLDAANERGGVISNLHEFNGGDAFRLADAHCAKFERKARVTETNAFLGTMAFECVEK
jgi:hypothetical protein